MSGGHEFNMAPYVDPSGEVGGSVPLGAVGGSVPQVPVGTTHPVLMDGHIQGHGGAALRLFVGLTHVQNQQLSTMGQVEAPRGRRGEFYWPLKSNAETSLASTSQRMEPAAAVTDVILRPISVTFVGLRDMLISGYLYACDGEQWRLYAPLRIPAPRDEAGNAYYEVHEPYTL